MYQSIVLILFGFLQVSAKIICTRRQYSIADSNFYQRIELPSAVACVERCVENADYCKAVVFVEQRESQKRRRLCQLYGVNSESKNVRVQPEATYEPSTTLYEIVDECARGLSSQNDGYDEADIMDRIDPRLRKQIQQMSRNSPETPKNKEVELTVLDTVHRPVDRPSVSGVSYDTHPPNPFAAPMKARAESNEGTEPSSFHAERDPIPIQPVSVSHAGAGQFAFNQSPFGQQYPCFSGRCRQSSFYQAQPPRPVPQPSPAYPTPCPASRRGDPCAPKEAFSIAEPVTEVPKPHWSEWSPLGTCSVTCGPGIRQRRRYCSTGHNSDCEGESTREEPCELPQCDIWSEWGSWALCSATCGGGEQRRTRYCRNGRNCRGESEDTRSCSETECPHWAQWGGWHECSASCGSGVTKRDRECLPVGSYGCPGVAQEHRPCESRPCPEWGPWQQWTECTKSCDGGERQRRRECLYSPNDCPGPAEEHILCNQQPCPIWTEWSFWSQCSVTCGDDGTRLRSRQCQYEGFPSNLCEGTAQDQSACRQEQCPFWVEWGSWSPCSATCGHGQQTRNRRCEPKGYGCQGGDRELRFCQQAVCPYWDQWSEWGGCSVSCGRGSCERRRRCIQDDVLPGAVLPSEEELIENGRAEDATNSNRKAALKNRLIERAHSLGPARDQDDGLNDQETHKGRKPSLNSHKLEVSQSDRRYAPRRKNNRKSESGSADTPLACIGPDVDRKECDAGPCCAWANWASWSACNAQCGPGSKVRTRMCQVDVAFGGFSSSFNTDRSSFQSFPGSLVPIQPQISMRGKRQVWPGTYVTPRPAMPSGGCECPGPSIETEICAAAECEAEAQVDPCTWSDWSSWCGCSGNCHQGVRARTRYCNEGHNAFGRHGRAFDRCECAGERVQTDECVPRTCSERQRGVMFSERDSMLPRESPNKIADMGVMKRKRPRTDEQQSEFIIRPKPETDSGELDGDEVTSCSWSHWSDWSPCGSEFLKQRTRFCVGLKALINNCECRGAAMEQTSCRPERDGHNFKPPPPAVLSVSRDILDERINKKQQDSPASIDDHPQTKIRAVNSSRPRLLTGADLIKAPEETCEWTIWQGWSSCIAECDKEGERHRTRSCPCDSCGGGITVEIEACITRCETSDGKKNPFD